MLVMHLSRLLTRAGRLVDSVMVQAPSAGVVIQVSRREHTDPSHFPANVEILESWIELSIQYLPPLLAGRRGSCRWLELQYYIIYVMITIL